MMRAVNFCWLCVLVCVLSLLGKGDVAYAQNQYVVVVGSDAPQSGGVFLAMNSDDLVMIGLKEDRCYCCTISAKDPTDFARFRDLRDPDDDSATVTARGTADPAVPALDTHPEPDRARLCFTAGESGEYNIRPIFGVAGNGVGQNVRIECEETTLYGGFNTSVTDYNFLEVTSRLTDGDVLVSISATDEVNGGVPIDALNLTPTIPAGGRLDIDVHTPAPGIFGNVTVCHDGPPGAVRAVVSQYNITTSPEFAPVASQELTTR